jgi:hypothetical protein
MPDSFGQVKTMEAIIKLIIIPKILHEHLKQFTISNTWLHTSICEYINSNYYYEESMKKIKWFKLKVLLWWADGQMWYYSGLP